MRKKKRKIIVLIHDVGCIMLIFVGILGVIRLIGYFLYGCSPEIYFIKYIIFIILEIIIGILGLVELNKKYLLK